MTAPMRNSTRAMISTHLRASTKSPTPPRISARISSTAIHIGAPFVQRTPITPPYRPQNAPPRISPRGVGISPSRPEGVCPPEPVVKGSLPGLVPHDRRECVSLVPGCEGLYQDQSPTTGGSVSPWCRDAKGSIRISPPRPEGVGEGTETDRKSTRLNSSHVRIS